MTNCPICGAQGDDLVFRFYCSNKECSNYVADGSKEKAEKKAEKKVDASSLFYMPVIKITCKPNKNGDVFSENAFKEWFDKLDRSYNNAIIVGENYNIEFLTNINFANITTLARLGGYSMGCRTGNCGTIPNFHISFNPYSHQAIFVWDERKVIPEGLGEKIGFVINKYIGYAADESNIQNMTNEIKTLFRHLVACGELFFDNFFDACWKYQPQE